MISWKHSFNRLNEENEIAKKKKQALDGLYEKGKISQSTHDSFNADIAAAIADIEKQQQELIGKMTAKTAELQGQIKTLEILLANYEIQHVAGEIDENTYTLEMNLLTNGLDTAKHELETIQNAVTQLCNPTVPEPVAQPAAIPTVKVAPIQPQDVIEVAVTAAPVEIAPAEVIATPEPIIQEPIATPIAEAPVVEAPAAVEQPEPIAQAEIAQPAPEPVVETPAEVVEQPVIVEQPAPVAEAEVVEQPAAEVAATPEPSTPEPATVIKEAPIEKPALDEFDVAEPDVVQKELLQAVEEIAENPLSQAPLEAHEEATVEAPAEVYAETQPVPIHTAKESLPEISSSDSESKE